MPHEMASGGQEHPSGDGHVTQRAAISCLPTNPGHALPLGAAGPGGASRSAQHSNGDYA